MKFGFLRTACASPKLCVADCTSNAHEIINCVKKASGEGISILVFPELCITGYTCADLFMQATLEEAAVCALKEICEHTRDIPVLFAVGLPLTAGCARYNTAAVCFKGKVLAVIPKTYIPNYSEFYERRWFTPYDGYAPDSIELGGSLGTVPFGTDIIIRDKSDPLISIAAEICEDAWVPLSPSTRHALAGATIILNLSASNEVVGKAAYRKSLVQSLSAKNMCAYVYADAGHDESTTDMVFSGHNLIALNGTVKAESLPFSECTFTAADLDMERIQRDRLRTTTFAQNASAERGTKAEYRFIDICLEDNIFSKDTGARISGGTDPHPFVPDSAEKRQERCLEVVEMQAEGLAKRLRHIHAKSAVVGLSGGLDSTLALLITARAFDKCGIDRSGILAVTMPAFGTTGRTYRNACSLAVKTGATLKEIDIKESVKKHFDDIGQDESVHDITYENSQARERTQILMDLANMTGAIVIGTGDLSELALGWCTYNGDQMSMYGVNSSIPKTLVRHLVTWFAECAQNKGDIQLSEILKDILDTPVSPELLPPDGSDISQRTEEIVGPYELHDFFLYYVLRWGFSPEKIYFLACDALLGKKADGTGTAYTKEIILKWMRSFYKRFFSQQFKRSCMPDGAKVGTVNLSPRGDWRMPSDAVCSEWLLRLDSIGTTKC